MRYAAAQALGRSRTGIEELVRLLDDPEWCVRQAAGAALVESGPAAVPRLEHVLRRGLAAGRAEAAEALGRLGSPAVIAGLEDRDAEVRVEAAIALRRIPKGLARAAAAREAFGSVLRAGRYRWSHWSVDAFTRSMGMHPATFPHWIDCLDGNCCMLTDGYAEELFTEALDLGITWLYGREHLGIGVSPRAIVLDAWRLYGGRFARSPILDRHLPVPE